jgi:hypothetical protein
VWNRFSGYFIHIASEHRRRGIYILLPSPSKQLDLALSEPSLQEARSYNVS